MSGAAFEFNLTGTDDESFGFTLKLTAPDGSPLVWGDYIFEYSLEGCGMQLRLTEGNGLAVNVAGNAIACFPDPVLRLRPGQYRHGLRYTHVATDFTTQQFAGRVTISEGNF